MSLSEHYIPIPTRLTTDLRDNPVAIGLYALVARLFFVVQGPVPLSRADLRRYDPSLREGAAKRALDRLVADGYLIEARGHKSTYLPSWGRSRASTDRPWRIGPRLACPTHIFTTRLDEGIFDRYMGRLIPHSRLSATISRYISAPLLGLRDIGAYVLTLLGQPFALTAALHRWGLVRDGQAQPLLGETELLALVSQRQHEDSAAPELLRAGWAKLGIPVRPPRHGRQGGQFLFFASKKLIGDLIRHPIGDLIGCSPSDEAGFSASERAKTGSESGTPNMPWNLRKAKETTDTTPNPLQQQNTPSGGGSISFDQKAGTGQATIKAKKKEMPNEPGAGGGTGRERATERRRRAERACST